MARIKELLARSGLSKDRIGARVHAATRDALDGPVLDPRGISIKLGELERGKETWWIKRPVLLRALAQVLDVAPEDLVQTAPASEAALRFVEFPELAPLGPNDEPCALADGWLGDVVGKALGVGGKVWISAPPGAGKTMALARLAHERGPSVALVEATGLDAVARAKDDRPLVAEVHYCCPVDQEIIAALGRRKWPVVVLAPFAAPKLPPVEDLRAMWFALDWRPSGAWRRALAAWCSSRLGAETRLDVEGVVSWLDRVDPYERLVATPGDLLPVLAWAHRRGTPRDTMTFDEIAVAVSADRSSSSSDGPRHHDARLLGGLAKAAIACTHDERRRPATLDEWADRLPGTERAARDIDAIRYEIRAAVASRKEGERRAAGARAEALLDRNGGRDFVERMMRAGFMRPGPGGLDLHPPWLRRGFERAAVRETIAAGTDEWATWAASPHVRPTVVDGLRAMNPSDVLRAVGHLISDPQRTLVRAAGIEAAFEALSDRLAAGLLEPAARWKPTDREIEALRSLGAEQVQLLSISLRSGRRLCGPLTAPRDHIDYLAEAKWITGAWAFSLEVPTPGHVVPEVALAFPVWRTPADGHDLLPALPTQPRGDREIIDAHVRFARVARLVAARVPSLLEMEPPPFALYPAVLIDGRAALSERGAVRLWGSAYPEIIAGLLPFEAHAVRVEVVTRAWRAAVARHGGNPIAAHRYLRASYPRFLAAVHELLPSERFADGVDADTLLPQIVENPLDEVPRPFAAALIRSLTPALIRAGRSHHASELDEAVVVLDDFGTLEQLAGDPFALGDAAAKRAWEIEPLRSLLRLEELLATGDRAAGSWIATAPAEHAMAVADAVLKSPAAEAPWLRGWLVRQAGAGGPRASAFFDLLLRIDARGASGS
jgi:hypothetical protein